MLLGRILHIRFYHVSDTNFDFLYYHYITQYQIAGLKPRNREKSRVLNRFYRCYLSSTIQSDKYTLSILFCNRTVSTIPSIDLTLLFLSSTSFLTLIVIGGQRICVPRVVQGWHHFYSSRKIKACPIASPDNHEYFICIISRHAPPRTFTRMPAHVSRLRPPPARSFFDHPGIQATWNLPGIVSGPWCPTWISLSAVLIVRVECKRMWNVNRTQGFKVVYTPASKALAQNRAEDLVARNFQANNAWKERRKEWKMTFRSPRNRSRFLPRVPDFRTGFEFCCPMGFVCFSF